MMGNNKTQSQQNKKQYRRAKTDRATPEMGPKKWLPDVCYYITSFGWGQSDQYNPSNFLFKLDDGDQQNSIAAKEK